MRVPLGLGDRVVSTLLERDEERLDALQTAEADVASTPDLAQALSIPEQLRGQRRLCNAQPGGKGVAPAQKVGKRRHSATIVGTYTDLSTGVHADLSRGVNPDNLRPMPMAERIQARMDALGTNPFATARRAGLQADYVRNIIRGKLKQPTGPKLMALAKALQTTPEYLLGETDDPTRPADEAPPVGEVMLPILYPAGAGAWLAADDAAQEPLGYAPAPPVKGYEAWPQWYVRPEGDSFNRKIPEGALVHVVDAVAMGYAPRHGDVVLVQRSRAQGAFIERTIKEVELTPGGVELWPRSYNPRWSEPLILTEGVKPGEDVEVRIIGKVLRAYIGF